MPSLTKLLKKNTNFLSKILIKELKKVNFF